MATLEQDLLANRSKLVATVADLVGRMEALEASKKTKARPKAKRMIPPQDKKLAGR